MAKKSQTATEFLIILAVVIVIALIVVEIMGGIPGICNGEEENNVAVENVEIPETPTELQNTTQPEDPSLIGMPTQIYDYCYVDNDNMIASGNIKNITLNLDSENRTYEVCCVDFIAVCFKDYEIY